jgi:RNA polymerase sigma-70 factor (ECF subfamily)
LALRAQTGDPHALDTLVESTYDEVWRLCSRLVDEQCADDLAQETFIRAVRSLPAFRVEASARTWLLRIARNTCMDDLRTQVRRRRRDASLRAEASRRPQHGVDPGHALDVRDLLEGLAHERRESFVLTQLLGLSYGEAAAVCECPVGTIRSRVARARADLLMAMEHVAPVPRVSRGNEKEAGSAE